MMKKMKGKGMERMMRGMAGGMPPGGFPGGGMPGGGMPPGGLPPGGGKFPF
jgi:signal recognition particle subunit SRP54